MSGFKPSIVLLSAALLGLAACEGVQSEAKYPSGLDRQITGEDIYGEKQSVLGEDGLTIFGKDKKEEGSSVIGVNSFLWRASLDTVSFMPLASADPFGGVIITDYYSPPETPDERFKMNVFILSRELRSDGIEVRVFAQELRNGQWRDKDASPETARKIENAILQRARQMRVAQIGSSGN